MSPEERFKLTRDFPKLLSLEYDPHREEIQVAPRFLSTVLGSRAKFNRTVRQIAIPTGVGFCLGGIGGVLYDAAFAAESCSTLCGAGGTIGFFKGCYDVWSLNKSIKCITPKVRQQAQKISAIIQALQEKVTEQSAEITCPISRSVFIYPVKTKCRQADGCVEHTFEQALLMRWIQEKSATCPKCRASIKIREIENDMETETKVREATHKMFEHLETLLQNLPRKWGKVGKWVGLEEQPDLHHPATIAKITEQILKGQTLLQERASVIADRCMQNNLSLGETYALAYCLGRWFKPITGKVKKIFKISMEILNQLNEQNIISDQEWSNQVRQLGVWVGSFTLISKKDFPRLHVLIEIGLEDGNKRGGQ